MLGDAEAIFGKGKAVLLTSLAIRQLKLGDDWRMIRLRELHVGPRGHRFVVQQFVEDLRTPVVG
jgi:hypothetical protein